MQLTSRTLDNYATIKDPLNQSKEQVAPSQDEPNLINTNLDTLLKKLSDKANKGMDEAAILEQLSMIQKHQYQ